VPLLVQEFGQFLLCRLPLVRERVDRGDDGGRFIEELEVLDESRLPSYQVVDLLLPLGGAGSERVVVD
jgi:hypothetical protein